MNRQSLENILKKVVQEIGRELSHRNIQVKDVFIRYYAGLLTLDPTWGISKDILQNRLKIQKFVKYVTDKLAHQFDPDIITLKMQLYFSLNCATPEEIIRRARVQVNAKLMPLQKEIIRVKTLGAEDSKTTRKFYKKLIYYITLHSGLGNPTHDNVYKEVQAAFRSAISDQEMREFVTKLSSEKRVRLQEYSEIVAGIRLFNRFCGKSGESIEDAPKMLRRAIPGMLFELQKLLFNVMQKVNTLTTIVNLVYVPKKVKTNVYDLRISSLPEDVTMNDVDRIKKLLVMYRQYELFVRQIISKITQIEDNQEDILDRLRKMFERINSVVQFKIAVQAFTVFPMFRDLAGIWFKLQDEAMLLSKYNDILVGLAIYTKQVAYPEYERQDWVIEQLLGEHQPLTDTERMREPSGMTLIPSTDPDFKFVGPEQLENMRKVEFELLGFCPWKLVVADGALVPGNPNIGFVENSGKRYIFSSTVGMNIFNVEPRIFIKKALEVFRRKPELINVLGVQDQLIAVKDLEHLIPQDMIITESFSVECQTVEHLETTNIVPSYKWNVWDLKREALLLANLSHCKTSSSQTEECAGVSPAKTQTYELRDKACQTKEDRATNVPRPLQFLFGLRGRLDDQQIQLDLTEPIEDLPIIFE